MSRRLRSHSNGKMDTNNENDMNNKDNNNYHNNNYNNYNNNNIRNNNSSQRPYTTSSSYSPRSSHPSSSSNGSNFVNVSLFSPSLRMTCYIPSELAGKVVGKKGVIISNIKENSRLTSLEAKRSVNDSLWSPIMMQGDFRAVKSAFEMISKIVDGINYY